MKILNQPVLKKSVLSENSQNSHRVMSLSRAVQKRSHKSNVSINFNRKIQTSTLLNNSEQFEYGMKDNKSVSIKDSLISNRS